MGWADIVPSAVAATIITGVVALIGFLVSSATALRINRDKLKLDKDLAQERAAADLVLAERKVALDRELALAKRRAEVAEQVLADFYKVQRMFAVIRSPVIWTAEMQPEESVDDDVVRNDGYGVIRRFRENASAFSELEATRFTFVALFGAEAGDPYQALVKVHNNIFHAAEALLRYRDHDGRAPGLIDFLSEMRKVCFSGRAEGEPDLIDEEIRRIIAKIEAICRPALESKLAAEAAGRNI